MIGYAEHVVELASLYLDREGDVDVDLRTTVILLLIAFGRHSFTRQTTTGLRVPRGRRGVVVSKKGKVFPYSLPSVGPGADPGVQAVSPQVT